ncbi:hypothetical protein Vadar_024724 [Vaccinium darrowii]|uniref:Uncharacterized protein n=1 Tax=Vaccinium darrowii TaxID=229202 RepID=A0ACB7X400_9ERIC|nr:hypothetical protein Vadar_024724 [Vaccinium darrowii]
MAGPLALVLLSEDTGKKAITAIEDQHWEVQYSRFFNYPPPYTHPSLTALRVTARNRVKGNWISSSSSSAASLNLTLDQKCSGFILTLTFLGKIYEEHYISKLHFSWPHVSCVAGFPTRGTRVVFIQKFALRFSTSCEVEAFVNALKEILCGSRDPRLPCGNLASEILSQSEFAPSYESPYRPTQDWNSMDTYTDQLQSSLNYEVSQSKNSQDTELNRDIGSISGTSALPPSFNSLVMNCHSVGVQPCGNFLSEISSQPEGVPPDESPYRPKLDWISADTHTDQMQSSLNNEIAQNTCSKNTVLTKDTESSFGALPPSFMSLVMSCLPVAEQGGAREPVSGDIDLKHQITRYLEDSSFQDMLVKVEKVISEIGEDLLP